MWLLAARWHTLGPNLRRRIKTPLFRPLVGGHSVLVRVHRLIPSFRCALRCGCHAPLLRSLIRNPPKLVLIQLTANRVVRLIAIPLPTKFLLLIQVRVARPGILPLV